MKKKALTTISALAITGSILVASPHSAHASEQNSNNIIDLARTQVSQYFDNDSLETTGAITDKGSYYEIPAYESTGVGGLKIIKVYKSSGKVTFEDNDTHKTENAGHINLKKADTHSVLVNDAVKEAIKGTHARPGSISVVGKIIDKGNYYKIPAIHTTGVGGLQIIKVYKSNGKVTMQDNDLRDEEVVGSLDLSKY
ncbi:MAG: hypothetical protein KZY51_06630 [Staphylococcaceae bacterium]|uniref:hypothetical protein n=1 Tax=Staphylococcus capitis TaxID=29388 RepID=UPI003459E6B9|nr:hypothetical protein [Staphylococcaceae bacterium]MBW4842985.1 hypothetical protein [Staphylococcaceae bacterium]